MRGIRCGSSDRPVRWKQLKAFYFKAFARKAPARTFATPGRRNPWDSVRLCMTFISP